MSEATTLQFRHHEDYDDSLTLTFQKSLRRPKFLVQSICSALETKQNFIVKADRFSQKVPEPAVCIWAMSGGPSKVNINLDYMSCVLCVAIAGGLVQFNNIAYLSACIVAERGLINNYFQLAALNNLKRLHF